MDADNELPEDEYPFTEDQIERTSSVSSLNRENPEALANTIFFLIRRQAKRFELPSQVAHRLAYKATGDGIRRVLIKACRLLTVMEEAIDTALQEICEEEEESSDDD